MRLSLRVLLVCPERLREPLKVCCDPVEHQRPSDDFARGVRGGRQSWHRRSGRVPKEPAQSRLRLGALLP